MENLGKQVVIGCVVHNNIGTIEIFDDTMECDDAWVGRSNLVKSNLTYVDLPLSGGLLGLGHEAFDSVGSGALGTNVHCPIHYAISAHT